jgi:stearoyl-CoA desaturase (delta-9 desaturase)
MIRHTIVFVLVMLHLLALLGLFLIQNISPLTIVLQVCMFIIGEIGITAGYHRLWCHRSYEASPLLEWLLMLFGSSTGQGDAINWCRTHRTHHRNEDLATDPHSISKGFFFAHIGWLLQYPDKETQIEIDKTDVQDLDDKHVLQFQKSLYVLIWVIISFIVPITISQLWNESLANAFFSSVIRNVLLLHSTWSVNSFAHMYGAKPYNDGIQPSENPYVAFFSLGEGWHNFHHTYPKDYRTSDPSKFNPTTSFIDGMEAIGLVKNKHEACAKTMDVRGDAKFDKMNYCRI